MKDKLLMIPGPTITPPEVAAALAKPPLGHRSKEFAALFSATEKRLRGVFQTENEVLIYTSSGTGAMEAAVVNLLSPGDKAINVSIGVFGDRLAKILKQFGAEVVELKFAEGTAADPAQVKEAIAANPDAKALYITFNETSTGVVNDLTEIIPAAKAAGLLTIVDAISGLVAMDLPTDKLGIDVVVAGSQKAFGIPPGLAFCTVSDAAWKAYETAKMPKFYWDFGAMRKAQAKGSTAWTPSVSLVFGLEAAVQLIAEEGLPACFARHKRNGDMVRAAMKALGLNLFADETHASNAVTSIHAPQAFGEDKLRGIINKQFDIVTTGGQGGLKGKIFRIGHLGFCYPRDIMATIAAFEYALYELKWDFELGAGIAAAIKTMKGAE